MYFKGHNKHPYGFVEGQNGKTDNLLISEMLLVKLFNLKKIFVKDLFFSLCYSLRIRRVTNVYLYGDTDLYGS